MLLQRRDDGEGDGQPLGWVATGDVLTGINDVLLARDELGCEEPLGELELVSQGRFGGSWTLPLCTGQVTEELVGTLRGL